MMQVILIVALCAVSAVIVGALLHLWISSVTARRDETEGVRYSALRGFLQNAGAAGPVEPSRGDTSLPAGH